MGTKLGRRSPEVFLGFAVALVLSACAQISGVGDLQFVGAHSDASANGGGAGAGGDTSGGAGGGGGDVTDANSGGGFSGGGGASGGAGVGGGGIGDAEAGGGGGGGGGAGAGGFGGSGNVDGSAGAGVVDAAPPLPCLDGGTLCPECMGALPSCCVTPSECGCIVPFFGGACLNNRRD